MPAARTVFRGTGGASIPRRTARVAKDTNSCRPIAAATAGSTRVCETFVAADGLRLAASRAPKADGVAGGTAPSIAARHAVADAVAAVLAGGALPGRRVAGLAQWTVVELQVGAFPVVAPAEQARVVRRLADLTLVGRVLLARPGSFVAGLGGTGGRGLPAVQRHAGGPAAVGRFADQARATLARRAAQANAVAVAATAAGHVAAVGVVAGRAGLGRRVHAAPGGGIAPAGLAWIA